MVSSFFFLHKDYLIDLYKANSSESTVLWKFESFSGKFYLVSLLPISLVCTHRHGHGHGHGHTCTQSIVIMKGRSHYGDLRTCLKSCLLKWYFAIVFVNAVHNSVVAFLSKAWCSWCFNEKHFFRRRCDVVFLYSLASELPGLDACLITHWLSKFTRHNSSVWSSEPNGWESYLGISLLWISLLSRK